MKHAATHIPHFAQAWRTLRSHKLLWLVSGSAALIGTGALLDGVLAAAFINFGVILRLPVNTLIAFAAMLVPVFVLAAWTQNVILHTGFAHAKTKKVKMSHAFHHGLRRLHASLAIHLLTGVSAGIVLFFADLVRTHWFAYGAEKTFVDSLATLAAIAILFIIGTLKLLALVYAAGHGEHAVVSIERAIFLMRRHPFSIIEHNAAIMIFAIAFLVGGIAAHALLITLLAPIIFFVNRFSPFFVSPTLITNIVAAAVFFLTLGTLSVFALSSWTQLVKTLERKAPFPTSIRRLASIYFGS
ncbi:MAG: hypothetical protein AAB886_01690 [Patescibacteria group bacterium]